MEEEKKTSRELGLIRILLEYPGGLRFSEFWSIVETRKICAKQTLLNQLNAWLADGLIQKDELGHYTLGLTQPEAQKILESGYDLPKKVERFLDTLYKAYERSGEKQTELFAQIGSAYLAREMRRSLYWVWLLFPFLFDKKVRKIWYLGYEYALNLLFDKFDEISQKFLGVKVSSMLLTKPAYEKFMTLHLEASVDQIKLEDERIADLISHLEIKDDIKSELKSQANMR